MQLQRPARGTELPLEGRRVALLVQAPLSQSPRMVAQAWMLAEAGAQVRFVAYGDANDFPVHHRHIRLYAMQGAGRDTVVTSNWPLLRTASRAAAMTRQLGPVLGSACENADMLLCQVPPAVPGLWLAARQRMPLVLDWHNLSASMAALKFGPRHLAVNFLARYETAIGRRAQGHFAVTELLAQYLSPRFSVPVHALPDRPLSVMDESTGSPLRPLDEARSWYTVVSPTSWSRDEAMGLLLDAVSSIDIPARKGLRVIATGKGPLRGEFESRAARLQRPGLRIETAWYSPAEYRTLLKQAHCGVSLHRSASGLDFPMKIIDMEAAGLPVLALDYGAALRDGLAGLTESATFADAAGLAALIEQRLVVDAPSRARPRSDDWRACWTRVALPVLVELMS